jgi:hypothetical protein
MKKVEAGSDVASTLDPGELGRPRVTSFVHEPTISMLEKIKDL